MANFDVIIIFATYSQFGAIRKADSLTFINSSFLSYKNWEQNWKISNTALTLLLWVKVLLLPKNADFFGKICWAQQNYKGLGNKRYIFFVYLHKNEPLKSPPRLRLTVNFSRYCGKTNFEVQRNFNANMVSAFVFWRRKRRQYSETATIAWNLS